MQITDMEKGQTAALLFSCFAVACFAANVPESIFKHGSVSHVNASLPLFAATLKV